MSSKPKKPLPPLTQELIDIASKFHPTEELPKLLRKYGYGEYIDEDHVRELSKDKKTSLEKRTEYYESLLTGILNRLTEQIIDEANTVEELEKIAIKYGITLPNAKKKDKIIVFKTALKNEIKNNLIVPDDIEEAKVEEVVQPEAKVEEVVQPEAKVEEVVQPEAKSVLSVSRDPNNTVVKTLEQLQETRNIKSTRKKNAIALFNELGMISKRNLDSSNINADQIYDAIESTLFNPPIYHTDVFSDTKIDPTLIIVDPKNNEKLKKDELVKIEMMSRGEGKKEAAIKLAKRLGITHKGGWHRDYNTNQILQAIKDNKNESVEEVVEPPTYKVMTTKTNERPFVDNDKLFDPSDVKDNENEPHYFQNYGDPVKPYPNQQLAFNQIEQDKLDGVDLETISKNYQNDLTIAGSFFNGLQSFIAGVALGETPVYLGSGTDMYKAKQENILPVNRLDQIAQEHDIEYVRGSHIKDFAERTNLMNDADKAMIQKINLELKSGNLGVRESVLAQLTVKALKTKQTLGLSVDTFIPYVEPSLEFDEQKEAESRELKRIADMTKPANRLKNKIFQSQESKRKEEARKAEEDRKAEALKAEEARKAKSIEDHAFVSEQLERERLQREFFQYMRQRNNEEQKELDQIRPSIREAINNQLDETQTIDQVFYHYMKGLEDKASKKANQYLVDREREIEEHQKQINLLNAEIEKNNVKIIKQEKVVKAEDHRVHVLLPLEKDAAVNNVKVEFEMKKNDMRRALLKYAKNYGKTMSIERDINILKEESDQKVENIKKEFDSIIQENNIKLEEQEKELDRLYQENDKYKEDALHHARYMHVLEEEISQYNLYAPQTDEDQNEDSIHPYTPREQLELPSKNQNLLPSNSIGMSRQSYSSSIASASDYGDYDDDEFKTVPVTLKNAETPDETLKRINDQGIPLTQTSTRFSNGVVSGTRFMRADLSKERDDYVKLTPEEKKANALMMSNLNFVNLGSGNGNQQIMPNTSKAAYAVKNNLLRSNALNDALRYSGSLNQGTMYIQRHPKLTAHIKKLNEVVMIPSTGQIQMFAPQNPATDFRNQHVGKPIKLGGINPINDNSQYAQRYDPRTRNYHINVINQGIRI